MTLKDILRLARENKVKISFEPSMFRDSLAMTIIVDIRKDDYHITEHVPPSCLENDCYLEYVIERLIHKIKEYEEAKNGRM
jgi:hypothetical protein